MQIVNLLERQIDFKKSISATCVLYMQKFNFKKDCTDFKILFIN